ncbi:plastocyanin/azurin family copper-binding protein [endosymbiont of Lamellibrachia barhami]|uniref:plastocyanin/azurin family copper-binding protein n=1 Tax=endosymbiont of Lamellibrachia barhami TaxID=205975 RepID=UPI0015AC8572|nr:plastocyanin/azurin family copper-binding protein [endosymbiont of Lamellibrachia barhami]
MKSKTTNLINIRRSLLVLVFALSASSLSAGGSQTPVAEIDIIKFKFEPQEITIKAGQRLRWINREKRQYHSVWFEQAGDPEPDYLFPDDTYERSFDQVGSFPYRCGPHPKMTGVVHVE